MCLIGFEPLAC